VEGRTHPNIFFQEVSHEKERKKKVVFFSNLKKNAPPTQRFLEKNSQNMKAGAPGLKVNRPSNESYVDTEKSLEKKTSLLGGGVPLGSERKRVFRGTSLIEEEARGVSFLSQSKRARQL